MDRITLVTTTHDRPRCIPLLERWVRRQVLQPYQWIVVDDGREHAPYTMGQDVIYREYEPDPVKSLLANWQAAIPWIAGDVAMPFEDDDWYSEYATIRLIASLQANQIAGLINDCYYHVTARRWIAMPNEDNASLAATAWRSTLTPVMADLCRRGYSRYLDVQLWGMAHMRGWGMGLRLNRGPDGRVLHVGLKGMPGAAGVGDHHSGRTGLPDPGGQVLDRWVGAEDAAIIRAAVAE